MSKPKPNFQDYQAALQRLRRRAHLRRAVMTRGLSQSVEMPILDQEEIQDRELCEMWQQENGFCPHGF
jgi:hypothetical protein